MAHSWTFGRKLGVGFATAVALTILVAGIAIYALRTVVAAKDRVISVNVTIVKEIQQVATWNARKVVSVRGFLLSRDDRFLNDIAERRQATQASISRLRGLILPAEGKRLTEEVVRVEAEHQAGVDRIISLRKTEAALETVLRSFDSDVQPKRDALVRAMDALIRHEENELTVAQGKASEQASTAITLTIVLVAVAVVFAIAIAWLLTRALSRQIGSAVQHIQSSSSELQTAANQQASGSKEQATAMNEITVTVQELLATARQIAESAQRVAKIAEDTASSAHAGDQTVQKAQDAVVGIKRQVDVIVGHMLELGKKSQQIGGILEIINELAEQTNILAINATIEAAGAGELGKRFGAVAEEIRKLADRVGGSTKEIRTLIDEVRAAVHTTVMATETGSKAVDAGTKQFVDVASAFKQIVASVATTTDAAREIELSTKQQSTAVEQVNVATTNVAQATKESEASAQQTVQTASDLAKLSHDLVLLIQPQARA